MLDKTTSILFSDLEKLFGFQLLTGEVTACKRITLQTEKGLLTLQVGDTEDHYSVSLERNSVLPSTEQIIEWIEEHHKLAGNEKFHFCPCLLGVPFYPYNNCECGG